MIKIAPSILSADFSALGEEVKRLEEWGADLLHIDVMDGRFVPNITFGPAVIQAMRPHTDLFFEVHLMIMEPERYIREFVSGGADAISVHQEASVHLYRTLELIKSHNIKAGVALNPATSLDSIKHLFEILDYIIIMSVNPGFGGQQFIPAMFSKIKEASNLVKGTDIEIMIDGGVNRTNISQIKQAGADIIVAGSAIFNAADPAAELAYLKAT